MRYVHSMSKADRIFSNTELLSFVAGLCMIAVSLLLFASCGEKSSSSVILTKAWISQTDKDSTEAYLAISSSRSDELLSVSVPLRVAASSTIYKTITTSSSTINKSVPVNSLLIKASTLTPETSAADCRLDPGQRTQQRGALILEPGGDFIRVSNLVQPLTAGGQVPLLLSFRQAGRVEVNTRIC